jgi:hypothetical protein
LIDEVIAVSELEWNGMEMKTSEKEMSNYLWPS